MTYTFNNKHIVTGYIKALLSDFNLPSLPVITNLMLEQNYKPIIIGRPYLYGNEVVKFEVDKSGKLNKTKLYVYEYNKKYLGITRNLVLNTNYYDSATHEYLGEYLRFIRDYHNLDLMSLYNCFSNSKLNRVPTEVVVELENPEEKFILSPSNEDYNYYIIPIKYDQIYTISLNCKPQFEICGYMDEFESISDFNLDLIKKTHKIIPGGSSLNPIIFKIDSSLLLNDYPTYWKKEKDLKLLIKLPSYVKTGITVLEGDFRSAKETVGGVYLPEIKINSNTVKENIFNESYSKTGINRYTRLSLLENITDKSYPFSDKLVDYLLENPITFLNKIPKNVYNIQKLLYKNSVFKGIPDIMDYNFLLEIAKSVTKINDDNNNINQFKINSLKSGEDGEVTITEKTEYNKTRFIDENYDLTYMVDSDIERLVLNNYGIH